MLKQIISVVGTRYIVAALNLILIFVNARMLGTEGLGTIGLILAAININTTVNSLLGGNTLVYFMQRYPIRMLAPIALIWIAAGSAAGTAIMYLAGILPDGYALHVGLLSALYSLILAGQRFLTGSNNFRGFNAIILLQGLTLFIALLIIYFPMEHASVDGYVAGNYISQIIAALLSFYLLIPLFRSPSDRPRPKSLEMIGRMLRYGLWSAADNMAETLATRLNYFLVEHFAGRGSVGLLDAATRIAESVWLISRSVAHIEYSRIARTSSNLLQRQITLRLLRITLIAITAAIAILALIPEGLYAVRFFGPGFAGIRGIILALAPGIIMLGGNTIMSHYFIGSGKVRYSAFSSLIGFSAILIAAPILIPAWGTIGAAAGSSIAFASMFLFSLIIFCRQHKA
ncbi:MAG: polysaccharide biosynthesis C-terminal domain-containing protein [Tannerellaceae bacterium]|jgi:O-antigen/teichoic acid export membrane protein|nr:polysaccharide biosynthesis C-terminal domain-containing protein [Tannerellaceae bacterium]